MENVFDGKICSYYKSIFPKYKGSLELQTPGLNKPLLDILTKEGYTNTTQLIKLRQSGYKSQYYENNKNLLSAATFSSVQDNLNISRSNENHLFHTGFIAFDIDPKENPMLLHGGSTEMRDYLIDNVPYLAYLGKSVSNIGFWGLFAIQYKDEHLAHFRAIEQYFKVRQIVIDSLPDVSRLRFIAYDPDAHIELCPEVFEETADANSTPQISEYNIATPSDDFFIACCTWLEYKHTMKFEHGSRHNYLRRLYSTLRYARVSRQDCLNWIYTNLIPENEVNSNCLDEIELKKWKE